MNAISTQKDSAKFPLQIPSTCGYGRSSCDTARALSLLCMDLDRQSIWISYLGSINRQPQRNGLRTKRKEIVFLFVQNLKYYTNDFFRKIIFCHA